MAPAETSVLLPVAFPAEMGNNAVRYDRAAVV